MSEERTERTEHFNRNLRIRPDTKNGRLIRGLRNEERIRNRRDENFSKSRKIARDAEIQESQSQHSRTKSRLDRWRAEREMKKKIEQRKKKPIFKVGVVHHKFYSPLASVKQKTISQPCHPRGHAKVKNHPTPPKRITRATQKRLEARNAHSQTPAQSSSSKCPASAKPKLSVKKNKQQSFAPDNYLFKAPSGIHELPMFGRIALPQGWESEWINDAMQKPWPTQDPTNATSTQEMRNREESVAAVSTENSSIEDSFKLQLSLDHENTEKIQEEKNEEVSLGVDLENAEANVVEPDDVPVETPPRSGTPVPASFSPYIVTSRGKDSVRKELQARLKIRHSSANEIPTKETVMQNLNISVEEEEQTAQYFKQLLQRETERLNDLCIEWEKIKNDSDISEDATYQISAAIGQTNLLLKKKFSRFESLINECETGKGELLVRCKDLEGFWELINREIKDCESRFLKLKILQSNGWMESESVVTKVIKKKTAVVPTKPKINAKSSARSWILAARKKKMLENFDRDAIAGQSTVEDDLLPSSVATEAKVDSPKKTITPKKTPTSLLKRVQLSQASKNVRSPLSVMKISKMCKTPEVTLDDTISYVNSDQTPAKGILKKSESTSESDTSVQKSSRKVDFNDELVAEEFPAAEVDESLQNSVDLGRALALIDSYDSDESVTEVPTHNTTLSKVRLNFEDEVFNETNAVHINITPATPLKKSTPESSSKFSRRAARNTITIEEDFVEDGLVRPIVLRNRTIMALTPTTKTRRSSRASRAHELSTSMADTYFKENCDPQRETNPGSENSENLKDSRSDLEHANLLHKRRSTRRSVRFNPDDDCKVCGETPKQKPRRTPQTRELKRVSLLGESRRESVTPLPGGDLMMFDTPAKRD